jgi:hypothetical protein
MFRKATTLFTLTAFALFSTACMTWTTADVKTMAKPPATGTEVLSVVKISGEEVLFSNSRPGHVKGNMIVGRATNVSPDQVSIPFSEVRQLEFKKSKNYSTLIVLLVVGVATVGFFAMVFKDENPQWLGNGWLARR